MKSTKTCKRKKKKLLSQPRDEGLPSKTLQVVQNGDIMLAVITPPCLWLPLAGLFADLKLVVSLQPLWGAPCPIQTSLTSIFSLVLQKEGTRCGAMGIVREAGYKNTIPVSFFLTMNAMPPSTFDEPTCTRLKNFEVDPATVTWHSWSQDDHKYDLRSNISWFLFIYFPCGCRD